MPATIVERIVAFKRGDLGLGALLRELRAHTWWVPIDGDEAYAEYDTDDVGYLTLFSGPGMAAAHERWERWGMARVLEELDGDPDLGVVFDHSYDWATHLGPHQIDVLRTD